jgi:rubrerythrin
VEVTGIISVASAGAWSTQLNVTIAADAIHSVAGDNQEQARAPGLQELPSAFTPLIFLLLVPLCIRSVIVLLSPALKNPSQHRCPYCSYDCRGSPLRCPECGSAVGVPNFRLDLNPKSREA